MPTVADLPGFDSDTLSPLTTANDDRINSVEMLGQPAWVVRYAEADEDADTTPKATILDELDSAGDAEVVTEHDTLRMLTVSAPRDVIGTRLRDRAPWGQRGLQANESVESIDLVVRLSHPEPVSLQDSVPGYDLGWRDEIGLSTADAEMPDWSGLAYQEDAAEATLQESRQLCRADASVLDGVDTSGVTIAVIDTGVDDAVEFEDADGNTRILDASTNTISGETVGEDGIDVVAANDSSEHGEWVTGCAAARDSDETYRGFADAADILAVKALDSDGSGSTEDIISGVELAIDQGADVACMSLGSPLWNEALADAIATAVENGVFVVVAVGNSRYSTVWVATPADSEDAFGVNACNLPESGNRDDSAPSYFGNPGPDPGSTDLSEGASNGAEPNLIAPGMAVETHVGRLSGTSMAAPHVAGAAAVLRASEPGLSVEETWDRLVATGYPLPNAGATEGARLLDLQAALANNEPSEDPSEVRSDEAKTRDAFNEWYSNAQGGRVLGLI